MTIMNKMTTLARFVAIVLLCAVALRAAEAPSYLFFPESHAAIIVNGLPTELPSDAVKAIYPDNGSTVELLFPVQKAYLQMPHDKRIAYFADQKCRLELGSQGYFPRVITLKWSADIPYAQTATVFISEEKDFAHAVAVKQPADAPSHLVLNNLKIATTYYWKVAVSDGKDTFATPVASFTTEDIAPRLINIHGIPNARDLGGRIGLNGKRVKQGMLYRTAGLNGNAVFQLLPAEKAKDLKPEHKFFYDNIVNLKAAYQKEIDANVVPRYVSTTLGNVWTAYYSTDSITLKDVFSWTKDFPGAVTSKVITADENNMLTVGEPDLSKTAVLIQKFEAEKDGYVQIQCGGDWFWSMAVNGQVVEDLTYCGNLIYPVALTNHTLDIPVKKGMNSITVVIRSGTYGWKWFMAPAKTLLSHKEVCEKRVNMDSQIVKKSFSIVGESIPGVKRLNSSMLEYMIQTLGIHFDLDLRSEPECYGMTCSPLGPSATWFQQSSSCYAGMAADYAKEAFAKEFKLFLDEKNYPMVFHCIGGQDRTGALAFILNGLLGVSEEELYLDWESTGFCNRYAGFNHENLFNHLVDVFKALPGKTINEQIENYVLSVGFTQDDIDTLRKIMLE